MNKTKSKTPKRTSVAVVGAGIGGLSTGLFLRARGFDVHLFEAKSAHQVRQVTERGNGIHLYFHCARMLQMAGLPIEPYLTPLDIQMRRDDGELRADITRRAQLKSRPRLSAIRSSVYSLLRQHLYKVLVEHTPAATLHYDKRCVSATQNGNQVDVLFDDDSSVTADLVIGADGIHSVLANQLFGRRVLDRHGIVIIQGLSEFDGLDAVETWLLRRGGGTMGLVPVRLPSKRPGTFWWLTLPTAEVESSPLSDVELYRSYCKQFSWSFVDEVAAQTDPTSLERWYSQDKDPLQVWCQGRIAMLGDACHAANPFSGYGAGMSIEDSYWLGRFLGDPSILDRPDDLATALERYQQKRVPHTTKIVRDARVLMRMLHPANRMISATLELAWRSRMPGPIIARKFMSVFEQGLTDTEWRADEKNRGRLAL